MSGLAGATAFVMITAARAIVLAAEPANTDAVAVAKEALQQARALYDQGKFVAALSAFRTAYVGTGNYKILYNIAVIEGLLDDPAGSFVAYEEYLGLGGVDVPSARRKLVNVELSKLEGRIGRLRVQCETPGAEVVVDGFVVGVAPLSRLFVVNPGRASLVCRRAGYHSDALTVEVSAREQREVDLVPVPIPAPPPKELPAAAPTEKRMHAESRALPTAAWLVTGAFVGATFVTGAWALKTAHSLSDERARFGADPTRLESLGARTKTLGIATDVLAATSVVSLAISLYLTFRNDSPSGPSNPNKDANLRLQLGLGTATLCGEF